MRVLLDTHVWWWWVTGERGLSAAQKRVLAKASPDTPLEPSEVAALPDSFHRDPADRIIIATARVHDATLLTRDERIIDAKLVPTIG